MVLKLKIFISIVLLIILVSSLLIANTISKKQKLDSKIAFMPPFSFFHNYHQSFSNKDIDPKKKRVILNYFSPNCEHCQYMASEFINDSLKLQGVQILMISSDDSETVLKFATKYKLSLNPNIIILRDTDYQFQKLFGTLVVPSFFIYEQDKLVKKVIGETKIENLIN